MCGILTARRIDKPILNNALHKFRRVHRRGYVTKIYENAYLGIYAEFQRLPLVAVNNESANAPYIGDDGTIIMLNGELYNYQPEFAGSEVEWIYQLYKMDKRTLFYLSLLKGEFAYVIIDQSAQRLICYRSMPGVVSLYGYFTKDGRWLISSEKLYNKQEPIEPGVYYSYKFKDRYGKLRKVTKWYDNVISIEPPPPESEFIKLFTNIVEQYVTHKDKDIKVTVSYSGGLDSSFVLCSILAKRRLHKDVTQIIACQYSGTPEYEIVKRNLDAIKFVYGIDYTLIDMHKEDIEQVKNEIVKRLPSAEKNVIKLRSALRNYLVAKYSDNPIIIGGEGADELFGGYPFFKGTDIFTFKRKQVDAIWSMQSINLDRTNNIPFIFTKEWRVPFLDYRVINFALQHRFSYGKGYLRKCLRYMFDIYGFDKLIEVFDTKYGNEERLSEQYLGMKSHDLENQ